MVEITTPIQITTINTSMPDGMTHKHVMRHTSTMKCTFEATCGRADESSRFCLRRYHRGGAKQGMWIVFDADLPAEGVEFEGSASAVAAVHDCDLDDLLQYMEEEFGIPNVWDFCPKCFKAGGEYTPTFDACAFCD